MAEIAGKYGLTLHPEWTAEISEKHGVEHR